jgi:hypothetical protein
MSQRPPHPQPEACLTMSRASRYKGGTVIAEDVWSLQEHRRRVANGDLYRPGVCGACQGTRLHVHDYVERTPLGFAMLAVLTIVRFICANDQCRATWRVLPAFLARHLWYGWKTVESNTVSAQADALPPAAPSKPGPTAPSRHTRQRWLSRLVSSARRLVVMLAQSGHRTLCDIAGAAGLDCTRRD